MLPMHSFTTFSTTSIFFTISIFLNSLPSFTRAAVTCSPFLSSGEAVFGVIDKAACTFEIQHALYHMIAPLYPEMSAELLAWATINTPPLTTLEFLGVAQGPRYPAYPRKLQTPKFLSNVRVESLTV